MNRFLDCGCCIKGDGSRVWCPTCANGGSSYSRSVGSVILDIRHPGELGAGIRGYSDTVKITVESGSPGGEAWEFAEFMRQTVAEWFDGARVTIRPNEKVEAPK
jgi:hypothetical protein